MINMLETFTVRGRTFESRYTDAQIVDKIIELGKANKLGKSTDFGRDLVMGFRRFSRFTPGQRPYAHEMVISRENPQPQEDKPLVGGFKSIYDHLQACRDRREVGGAGLKNPMVRISLNGTQFALKLTGPKSKRPRHISVSESHRFGEGRFYGYINEAGELERYGACGNDVIDLLNRIACDPAREISAIGRESGLCCYCSAGLTQVQSKIAGCGKTCADKYGVWYPNAKETREYLPEHPAVLVGATDANKWN